MHVPMLLRVRMGRHCRVVLCWALLLQGFVESAGRNTKKKVESTVPVLATLGTGGFLKGGVLAALLQVGRRLAGD